tara:strand:- start:1845 stop:2309 length:465 start_codon:yes stop_codon:yes gene_type:complete
MKLLYITNGEKQVRKWSIKIDIIPQPKQSTQFSKRGFAYTPAKKRKYQKALKDAIAASELPDNLLEGPLSMGIYFCFPLTKSDTATKKKRQKLEDNNGWIFASSQKIGDLDNLMKPVSDALNGLVIVDDGHICIARITKIKAAKPYIQINLSEM